MSIYEIYLQNTFIPTTERWQNHHPNVAAPIAGKCGILLIDTPLSHPVNVTSLNPETTAAEMIAIGEAAIEGGIEANRRAGMIIERITEIQEERTEEGEITEAAGEVSILWAKHCAFDQETGLIWIRV